MLSPEILTENVARGAALLDQHRPGWARRIDPMDLVMSNCTRCVLGQLHGPLTAQEEQTLPRWAPGAPYFYERHILAQLCGVGLSDEAEHQWAVQHGFASDEFEEAGEWQELKRLWTWEILTRQRAAVVTQKPVVESEPELVLV